MPAIRALEGEYFLSVSRDHNILFAGNETLASQTTECAF
jgi:hypothetical protein